MKKYLTLLGNQRGMSLIELIVAGGLTAMIIGLTVTPIVQMKQLESKVAFQTSLDIAHQIAVQRARNGSLIKTYLGIAPGNQNDKCFGGRGTGCQALTWTRPGTSAPEPIGGDVGMLTYLPSTGGQSVNSIITVTPNCPSDTHCDSVSISVRTVQSGTTGTTSAPDRLNIGTQSGRVLSASFTIPGAALASRQEINFSCASATSIITGINYDTLTAECQQMVGNSTCASIAGAGPMNVFGATNNSDPSNCQVPVNTSCPAGMAQVGLINGQAQCASSNVNCSDPLSTACTATPTTIPSGCTPNWQPLASAQCLGQNFTQNDVNNCPGSVPKTAVGTNAAACMAGSCSFSGTIKWPDPVAGPCSANANLNAAPGASDVATNQSMGYYGTYTAACSNNASPTPNTFNMATATQSCQPVTCSGVVSSAKWSATGMQSAASGPGVDTVGPWNCAGNLTITQSKPQGPGILLSTQADPSAQAVANNTAATASAGNLTITCNDPGPVTAARNGVLNISAACTPNSCAWKSKTNFHGASPGYPECNGDAMTGINAKYPGGCTSALEGTTYACNVAGAVSSNDPMEMWTCSCNAAPPPPAGTCDYVCISNFEPDYSTEDQLTVGQDSSSRPCLYSKTLPTKFNIQCTATGTTCGLVYSDNSVYVSCGGSGSPPTATTLPAISCSMPPKFFGGGGGCWTYTFQNGKKVPPGFVYDAELTGVGCPGTAMTPGSCQGIETCMPDGSWSHTDNCVGARGP